MRVTTWLAPNFHRRSIQVYDGWLANGESAFNNENGSVKPNIYSLRSRARIHFKSSATEMATYAWRVSSVIIHFYSFNIFQVGLFN